MNSIAFLASEMHAHGPVIALACTGNGSLYSVCQTGSLSSWDELGLQPHPSWGPKLPAASALATSSNSCSRPWLATAHKDFKIRIWREEEGTSAAIAHAPEHASTLPSLRQFFHNWTMHHRYVQTRRHGKKRAWMQHADVVSALAFAPDHSCLYSASWDRTVKVWNLIDMHCEESFNAHIDAINSMIVGEQDGLLYTGSADKLIKVWSKRTRGSRGKHKARHVLVVAMEGQGAAVNAMVMSPNGGRVYSAGSDGRIVVWKKSKPCWPDKAEPAEELMKVEDRVHGHAQAVLCLAMHPNGALLVSGSADKTLRLWAIDSTSSATACSCLALLTNVHDAPVRSIAFSPLQQVEELQSGVCNSSVLYSGSLDGSIKMWILGQHENDEIDSNSRELLIG